MIKRISYILLFCVVFAACKDKSSFVIEGQFKNAKPGSKVYLFGLQKDLTKALDSVVLSENGSFKFKRSTIVVDFFKITSGNGAYMIIAKNGDQIKMNADLADKTLAYHVSGAPEADKLEELNKLRIAGQKKAVLKFAQDNTNYLTSFYAITLLNPKEYLQELGAYATKIRGNFNDNEAVSDFVLTMAQISAVQVGQSAKAFTINGMDGKPIQLSDFKGKYVMIDFWASWCGPCRQENPNVVKAYHTYKDKNFTVLGISLDKDATAWKKAVVADQLTWAQGSDLKGFESPTAQLYAIEAIPTSFIVDPSGKIIAKNLRGEQLDEFLSKTLH